MDPVSCVALATGAFKALKGAIGAGKDLQDMTGQLSQWGKAFSDFTNIEEREKNPPFWKKTLVLIFMFFSLFYEMILSYKKSHLIS